jgi:hypothetical protein
LLEGGLVVTALGKNFEQNFYIFSFLLRADLVVIAVGRVWFFGVEENEGFCLLRGTKNVQIVQEFC